MPGRSGDQREPDRPDRVSTSQQPERAQQHMGLPTSKTPRPARAVAPHPTPANPQHPQPGPPPRGQHPPTPRALQPAIEQGALDFGRVSSYDLHQCPQGIRKSPPDHSSQRSREGSCASTKTRASPPLHRQRHSTRAHHECHQPTPACPTNVAPNSVDGARSSATCAGTCLAPSRRVFRRPLSPSWPRLPTPEPNRSQDRWPTRGLWPARWTVAVRSQ